MDKTDKSAEVCQYVNILNTSFLNYGVFSTHLAIDEQMIPYYGRHSCEKYFKGKPVRFGCEDWCSCSTEGFLYNFDICKGKSAEKSGDLGLEGDVVARLLRVAKVPANQYVYFDNFFTSKLLSMEFDKPGFYATGAIRDNRLGKCPLTPVN